MKGKSFCVKYLGFNVRYFSRYGSAVRYLLSCADKVQCDYKDLLLNTDKYILEVSYVDRVLKK